MIAARTSLDVADNTGARRAQCIHVLGQRKRYAHIGDIIKVSIKEAQPVGMVKKGEVHDALIVRTKQAIRRPDGSFLARTDDFAAAAIAVDIIRDVYSLNYEQLQGSATPEPSVSS